MLLVLLIVAHLRPCPYLDSHVFQLVIVRSSPFPELEYVESYLSFHIQRRSCASQIDNRPDHCPLQ